MQQEEMALAPAMEHLELQIAVQAGHVAELQRIHLELVDLA
jgi:hypothetical protein